MASIPIPSIPLQPGHEVTPKSPPLPTPTSPQPTPVDPRIPRLPK